MEFELTFAFVSLVSFHIHSNMNYNSIPESLKLPYEGALQLFPYYNYDDFNRHKIHLTSNTISFLRHGTKEVVGQHANIKITPNQFIIMKAGNCLMTENISEANRFYKSVLFFFTNQQLLDFIEKHNIPLDTTSTKATFYPFHYDDYLTHYVNSLEKILQFPPSAQQQLLPAKFEELMLYLMQQEGTDFINGLLQRMDNFELQFTHIIEHNRLKKLTLQELSFLCNMSISTFKRSFQKHYQQSPSKWFQAQRLKHAAFLLKTTPQRPIDLYEDAGYENLSNFVQAFKKKYQKTPKQYQLDF